MSESNIRLDPARMPQEIENRSLGIIDSEVPEPRPFAGVEWEVVRRMIHTTADFELLELVRFHADAVRAGVAALKAGARIVTDTEMARAGIPLRRMEPLGCSVTCLMNDPRVAELARENGTTRALAAVDVAVGAAGGAPLPDAPDIWVVGNAPTALIRLLEHVRAGRTAPALVVGMPVGFVNAAESKELLLSQDVAPFVTIRGRKGGSALAASVINALADVVLRG
ncbi:precorrin-8X methylmutase [Paucidesulfovibrio longus]|uniref:precorrin-8X methylmutase n=1 Tax=Paucidesulfovibrio longus TaxID=889 RepID=UPI0003B77B5B|nr:precorrin-8X methylmutase [Paucidesulfovibrio longus]